MWSILICLKKSSTVSSLADDRSIVNKKVDKGSGVVVWDRSSYLLEAEKKLSDTKVYRDAGNTESKLSEASNKIISSLERRGFLTKKQMKHFTYEFKKPTNFGKLYFLPKIHKCFIISQKDR